jgi:hypothetical protein
MATGRSSVSRIWTTQVCITSPLIRVTTKTMGMEGEFSGYMGKSRKLALDMTLLWGLLIYLCIAALLFCLATRLQV